MHRSRQVALSLLSFLAPLPALAASPLEGFDADLALLEVSGLSAASGAYENQLVLEFEPSYRLGERFFAHRWAEPLVLSAQLSVEAELSGNDPRFRGVGFSSPLLMRDAPEQSQLAQAAANGQGASADVVDGLQRQAVLSDLRLSLTHGQLLRLPLGVKLKGAARVILPTSGASRSLGMRAVPSVALGLEREVGRFTLSYEARYARYLFARAAPAIVAQESKVLVNGQEVEPYRPFASPDTLPQQALVNSLGAEVKLPASLSLSVHYALVNTLAHPLSSCWVEDVPLADVCRDGPALGQVQARGQRDSGDFFIELSCELKPWLSVALGLSTSRPVRTPAGEIANPFIDVSRHNYTTAFLSITAHAEALAARTKPN